MSSKIYFKEVADQWDTMRKGFFTEAVSEKAYDMAAVKGAIRVIDLRGR